MTQQLGNGLRGALFFSLFWPSFTRLGFSARQALWRGGATEPRSRRGLQDPHPAAPLSGQTWLVTGASAGIGREIARSAADAGARVVAVARRGDALEQLARQSTGVITPIAADLSQIGAIPPLVESLPDVDVLINNVGVMFNRPQTTPAGLDAGFATNLLGPYALTETMLEQGRLGDGGSVITMTSGGAYTVPLALEPLTRMQPYEGTLAYAYHKRAQIALNTYWRGRFEPRIRFYVTHPGWVATPGVAEAMPLFNATFAALLRTVQQGADTALWLGTNRPASHRTESVWFDRAEQPAHLLPGTREGAETADLIALLDADRARLRPPVTPTAPSAEPLEQAAG